MSKFDDIRETLNVMLDHFGGEAGQARYISESKRGRFIDALSHLEFYFDMREHETEAQFTEADLLQQATKVPRSIRLLLMKSWLK